MERTKLFIVELDDLNIMIYSGSEDKLELAVSYNDFEDDYAAYEKYLKDLGIEKFEVARTDVIW